MIVVSACVKAQLGILVSFRSILNSGEVNSKPVLKGWPLQTLRQMTTLAEWLLVVSYPSYINCLQIVL